MTRKKDRTSFPFGEDRPDAEDFFSRQGEMSGKPPMMPKGKPGKGGGFMQALRNAKKKAPKKKGK